MIVMRKWFFLSLFFLSVVGTVVWQTFTLEKKIGAEDYLALGIDKGSMGSHYEAIEQFKNTLKEDPDFVAAYLALGNAYGNAKKYKDAINAYKEGIQINPRHKDVPKMEMNIAWVSHKNDDEETAIIFTKKAIQSFTDRNDYKGVAEAAIRLRLFQNIK
jgi:tetratricopeptide (TPR) repeat protein